MWQPSAQRIAAANLTEFARQATTRFGRRFASPTGISFGDADYLALHRWSVDHPAEFWSLLWDFAEVRGTKGDVVLADGDKIDRKSVV